MPSSQSSLSPSPHFSTHTNARMCAHTNSYFFLLFSLSLSFSLSHTHQNAPGTKMDWVDRVTPKFRAAVDCDDCETTFTQPRYTTNLSNDMCIKYMYQLAFSFSRSLGEPPPLHTSSHQEPAPLTHLLVRNYVRNIGKSAISRGTLPGLASQYDIVNPHNQHTHTNRENTPGTIH